MVAESITVVPSVAIVEIRMKHESELAIGEGWLHMFPEVPPPPTVMLLVIASVAKISSLPAESAEVAVVAV